MTNVFFYFTNRIAQKMLHLSSFSLEGEKKKTEPKFQNTAITFHVIMFKRKIIKKIKTLPYVRPCFNLHSNM